MKLSVNNVKRPTDEELEQGKEFHYVKSNVWTN